MNDMISSNLSMTSIEIADLVGSRHSDVKRSIERLIEAGVIHNTPTANCGRINGLGLLQQSKHYLFEGEQGRRDSIVVVAQLSPEFTGRMVDRWQELEQKVEQLGSEEQLIQHQPEIDVVALACAVAKATVSTAIKTALGAIATQQLEVRGNYPVRGGNAPESVTFDYVHPFLPFEEKDFARNSDSKSFLTIRTLSINTGIPEHVCRRLIEFADVPTRKTGKHTRLIDSEAFIDAAQRLINESKPPKGRIKRWNHPVFGGFVLRDVPTESKQAIQG